jgi:bifunctional enzyme CysN/CysC
MCRLATHSATCFRSPAFRGFSGSLNFLRILAAESVSVEVFVDTPIEECMRRDPKGLYARAKEGKIKNFTGIDSPYEAPENPEIVVHTSGGTPEEIARRIVENLRERRIIG